MTSEKTIRKTIKRDELYEATNGDCFYCGCPVEEYGWYPTRDWLLLKNSGMVVEHKTPLIRGGSCTSENLVCACFDCNSKKGMFTLEEYRMQCALRAEDLNFRFVHEPPAPVERDWIICHSPDHERELLVASIPTAAAAYSMRRNSHARSKTWRPQADRGTPRE